MRRIYDTFDSSLIVCTSLKFGVFICSEILIWDIVVFNLECPSRCVKCFLVYVYRYDLIVMRIDFHKPSNLNAGAFNIRRGGGLCKAWGLTRNFSQNLNKFFAINASFWKRIVKIGSCCLLGELLFDTVIYDSMWEDIGLRSIVFGWNNL